MTPETLAERLRMPKVLVKGDCGPECSEHGFTKHAHESYNTDYDALAREALAWVEERLLGVEELDEIIKLALTGACPHGKRKLGPCRMCAVARCRTALLALIRERLK